MRGIELEFINRACETGVDLNDAADHKHRSHSLQFVAGFGYFKSQALLRVNFVLPGLKLNSGHSDFISLNFTFGTDLENSAYWEKSGKPR